MKWAEIEIKELGRVVTGKTPPTNERSYFDGEFPFVSPKDLDFDSRFIENTLTTITSKTIDKFKGQVLPKNSVMFTSLSYGFGKMGITASTSITNQQIHSIIVDKSKHDFSFVYYLLRHYKNRIFAYNAGIVTPIVPKSVFEKIKVLVPAEMLTQRKIGSILSAYDDLIEKNLKRIKLLEEKAQLLYAQYKPIEKFKLQNKAEYLGRGISPKYEEGSGFYAINQKANKGSMLDYNHFKSLDTKLEVPIEKFAKWGDLLINSLGEGTLGRVHFFTDKSDLYAVDQHMSIFRTSELHYTFYLYQFLASDYGQGLIETLKKGGTNMTMLNISDLRQLEVSFPKEKELKELWSIAEPMYKLKQILTSQNTKLREARDILLPKLMNGQIEV